MKRAFLLLLVIFSYCIAYSQEPSQSVRGVVTDDNLNKPVIGATVKVISGDTVKGAYTDAQGAFKIKNVPVGRYDVIVSSVGFKKKILNNVLVISGKETFLTVQITEDVVVTKAVIISAEKDIYQANNDIIESSYSKLRPETINRYAGSRSDPARMAATTAGAAGDNNQRNDIIVRGNSPLGALWRLEGVEIPNPNHFTVAGTGGGVFAIINNNYLANCDFITGAFPAEYGNKTAAVFDVYMRNGNNEVHEKTFQLGLNGLELGVEGPISKENRSSYLAGARFVSLQPLNWLGFDLSANVVPEYADFTYKLNFPTTFVGSISFWGIGGYNKASVLKSEDVDWSVYSRVEDENIESGMFAAGIDNIHFFGDNTFGKLILSSSGSKILTFNDYVFRDKSKTRSENFNSFDGQHILSYTVSHKIDRKNFLKIGAIYKYMYFDNYFEEFIDALGHLVPKIKDKGSASMIQAFGHYQHRFTDDFDLNFGVYYQNFFLNNSSAIEPRASLSLKLTDNQKITLAYGAHSQTQPLIYYFQVFPDSAGNLRQPGLNLGLTRSHHFVLGYQNIFWDDFRFKADAYYQYLFDIPTGYAKGNQTYSYANLGAEFAFNLEDSVANIGEGRNYGIEFTLEKSFKNSYYFLLTLSLFKSQYMDGGGTWRSTAFDLGYVSNILGGYEFKLDNINQYTLSVDLKVSYIGGRRYIPFITIDDNVYRDNYHAFESKLKDYFQTDLKLTLNINLENTTHNIFLAVDNLFNTENQIKATWSDENHKVIFEKQLGLLPYFGYRINF
ncbi:MAG: hypothetical protein QG635_1216, partial [Bacteroidota bacterium]|nr:hypothetical protein [Bacteroidota bacterium]